MRPFFEFWTFFLLSVQLVRGWDQIVTPSFKEIFPKIADDKIWSLTFHVNKQKTTEDAKKYLNSWIDENWEEYPESPESIVTDSEVVVTSSENPPKISRIVDHAEMESSGDYDYSGDSGSFESENSGDSEDVNDYSESSGDFSGDFIEYENSGSGDSWNFDFDNFEDSEGSGDLDYEYSGSGDYFASGDSEDVTSSEAENPKKLKTTPKDPFMSAWRAYFNHTEAPPTFEENSTMDYENFLIEGFFDKNSTSSDSEKFKKFKRAVGGSFQQKWEAEWFKYDTTTPPPWKKRCLSDKEYARNQALSFLDHRETLKMYIRYIFKMSQMDGLLRKGEAEEMRYMFWKNDKYYNNKFSSTEYAFLSDMKYTDFHTPSSKIESSLRMYAAHWDKFPPIAEKLHWVVQEDYWCWYEKVQYNW